jgi:hypothetical protein
MQFTEAYTRLKVLANGKYFSMEYGLTEYATGLKETKCWVYVDSRISAEGKTWEQALLNIESKLLNVVEELPEVDG